MKLPAPSALRDVFKPSDRTATALQRTTAQGTESAHGVARFLLYAALGAIVGAIVIVIEWTSLELVFHHLIEAPLWVQATAPAAGIAVTAAILHLAWRSDAGTSDKYLKAYHGNIEIENRRVPPKLLAAMTTVGSGGALGLEGPSIYAGAAVGQWMGRRQLRVLGSRAPRVLLAAGAAAGVAAIFRAPATGVLFALEAPFRRDIARHALIPALVASAAAYITFVVVLGADRLFVIGAADVPLTDEILGAIVLGLFAGVAARAIASMFHKAKDISEVAPLALRLPVGGAALVLAALGAHALVDKAVTLGPGAELITEVVLDPTVSVWTIIALFVLRAVATSATLGAGGVGGVFIPLAAQGLLLGRVVEVIFDAPSNGLFPVVGLAAVLGAGYRTPMAAVMFVAETTGRSEFVIPALIATAISQSLMGDVSVSTGQIDARKGQLERRLALPTSAVTLVSAEQARLDDSLLDVVDRLDNTEMPVVPVFDRGYEGLLVLSDIALNLMQHGTDATVATALRDVPAVEGSAPAVETVRIMNEYNTAAVAVVDEAGALVGVVTATSLAGLDALD